MEAFVLHAEEMTWNDRALLITSISAAVASLAATLLTLLRACQTYHLVKNRED